MARLRARDLPHTIRYRTVTETAEGEMWGVWSDPVPAYIEQKSKLVIDRRSTSTTSGQEITSTTLVILLPQHDLLPRTQVEVMSGTPRARISEVVDSGLLMYNRRTPNHVELRLE